MVQPSPDAGDHVLQHAPGRRVVEHVARYHRGHLCHLRHGAQPVQPHGIARPEPQAELQVAAVPERGPEPVQLAGKPVVRHIGQQDGEQPLAGCGEVGPGQDAAVLAGTPLAQRQQAAQATVAGTIQWVDQQGQPVPQVEAAAHHEAQADLGGPAVRAGDAAQRVVVGEAQGVVAERLGGDEQLLHVAGAAQERGVGGDL